MARRKKEPLPDEPDQPIMIADPATMFMAAMGRRLDPGTTQEELMRSLIESQVCQAGPDEETPPAPKEEVAKPAEKRGWGKKGSRLGENLG